MGQAAFLLLGFFATQALAEPQLRLGGRITAHASGFQTTYLDTTQNLQYRMTYEDPYWAVGLEAEYGPIWLFRVRLDLAEARVFWEGAGAIAVFPAVGLDLMCEPPVHWRLVPYAWGGGQLTRYFGNQGSRVLDPRFITVTERHIRAGIGTRFVLSKAVDIFCEVQVFNEDTYASVDAYNHEAGHWIVGGIGPSRAHLGARVAVTK
jgi:hypothetical protein